MIQLSKRLQAVANLVIAESKKKAIGCVADVGTDHGYIPIYLLEHGVCQRAIAMDIKKGPLQRAKEHIEQYGLGAYIETRLSDGLVALKKGETQVVVIAGMGGKTMEQILEQGKLVIDEETIFILQPQSELKEFRQYLEKNHFCILCEDMICEDGKYYPMMVAKKGKSVKSDRTYSEIELCYGPILLERRHAVLKEFLEWQLSEKVKILKELGQKATAQIREKRQKELEIEIEGIKQALQIYKEV